jgi:hypothetical protein
MTTYRFTPFTADCPPYGIAYYGMSMASLPSDVHCHDANDARSVTKKLLNASDRTMEQGLGHSQVIEDVALLQRLLLHFVDSLPDTLKRSASNVAKHFGTSELAGFVMLHTWICELHIELYRFSLPTAQKGRKALHERLPQVFLNRCRGQALSWALSLAQFWESLRQLQLDRPPGPTRLVVADFSITTCVAQSTLVLLDGHHCGLYPLVKDYGTAPLLNAEIDANTHHRLVQNNIRLLDDMAFCMPRAGNIVSAAPVSIYRG